jgi:predicted TIM-barrel fold metal-dependent hydrolase
VIDVNAAVGRWPFAAGWAERADELAAAMADAGVRQAHVSAVEAVLAPDPLAATQRACDLLTGHERLIPAAVADPTLRTAEADLRRVVSNWPVRLVKLYPSFGGYSAEDDRVAGMVQTAGAEGVLTAVVMRLEDDRNQHRVMRADPVGVDAVTSLAAKVAPLPLLVLNGLKGEVADLTGRAENLLFDIAFVESGASLPDLLRDVPAERLVFGSNAPLFYPQAAAAKLAHAEVGEGQRRAIAVGNIEGIPDVVGASERGTLR